MQTNQLLRGPAVTRGISLPKSLNDALREQAQQEDRSASWIIKRALILYLDQGDGKDQEREAEGDGQ